MYEAWTKHYFPWEGSSASTTSSELRRLKDSGNRTKLRHRCKKVWYSSSSVGFCLRSLRFWTMISLLSQCGPDRHRSCFIGPNGSRGSGAYWDMWLASYHIKIYSYLIKYPEDIYLNITASKARTPARPWRTVLVSKKESSFFEPVLMMKGLFRISRLIKNNWLAFRKCQLHSSRFKVPSSGINDRVYCKLHRKSPVRA